MSRVLNHLVPSLVVCAGVLAAEQQPVPAAGDSSWLKSSQLVTAIIAAILGGIVMATINIAIAWWKGLRWVVFTTLQSGSGPRDLMSIVEGELRKNPRALMELIEGEVKKSPNDLMAIVHDRLNSPGGHEMLAKYVFGYMQTPEGRTAYQNYILGLLDSHEAEDRMRGILTRLNAARLAQEKVEQLREATVPADQNEAKRRERAYGQSEIAEKLDRKQFDDMLKIFKASMQTVTTPGGRRRRRRKGKKGRA